jgi:hypothetical protein
MRTTLAIIIMTFVMTLSPQISSAQEHSYPSEKSKTSAFGISLAATVLPIIAVNPLLKEDKPGWTFKEYTGTTLIIGGLVFGPGTGHLYAGNKTRFWSGAGIRATGIALFTWGAGNLNLWGDDDEGGWALLFLLGSAITLVDAAYDIVTVGSSVDKYNRIESDPKIEFLPYYKHKNNEVGIAFSLHL